MTIADMAKRGAGKGSDREVLVRAAWDDNIRAATLLAGEGPFDGNALSWLRKLTVNIEEAE